MKKLYEIEMASGEGGDIELNVETRVDSFEEITQIEPDQVERSETRNKERTLKHAGGQDHLQLLVQQRLDALDADPPLTIFRAPAYLRKKGKYLYEPRFVSIGPYYHGRRELQTMEEHKWRCLRDFLSRNTEIGTEVYLNEMRALEMLARRCYSESVKMSSDKFVLMLLLDGCFILQYYYCWQRWACDTLFWAGWHAIYLDLLLLENQIPFFVIHKLAVLLLDSEIHTQDECPTLNQIFHSHPFEKLLRKTAVSCDKIDRLLRKSEVSCNKIDHLLHFYYKCMVPKFDLEQINSQHAQPCSIKKTSLSWLWSRHPSRTKQDSSLRVFPCATILHEKGVTFRRKKTPCDMFDITFRDGVMEMPLLSIADDTNVMFTNVVSYEQSQYGTIERTFTSFVFLMDLLIDSANDVTLLKECGIIESLIQSDQDVAQLFNGLGEGVALKVDTHYFASLLKEVQKYSNSTWPKYRARLMHDYFSNPWTSISVFAGVLLLGLSATQTYYTIYSSYHH